MRWAVGTSRRRQVLQVQQPRQHSRQPLCSEAIHDDCECDDVSMEGQDLARPAPTGAAGSTALTALPPSPCRNKHQPLVAGLGLRRSSCSGFDAFGSSSRQRRFVVNAAMADQAIQPRIRIAVSALARQSSSVRVTFVSTSPLAPVIISPLQSIITWGSTAPSSVEELTATAARSPAQFCHCSYDGDARCG